MCMPVGRFGRGVVSSAESLNYSTVSLPRLSKEEGDCVCPSMSAWLERIPQRRVKLFCSQEMRARSEGEGREDRVVLR